MPPERRLCLTAAVSTVDFRKAPLTYNWTAVRGDTTVTLTGETTDTLSFTADTLDPGDDSVTQVFDLTVTDSTVTGSASISRTDTVEVTVTAPPAPPNAKPTAVAMVTGGQTTVQSGAAVEIRGNRHG